MQLQQPFNARSVSPAEVFTPVPPGDYKVRIIESDGKPTSAGDGGFLELKLQILEGQFQNREVFYRLNLWNKSQQAVEIAYRQLSALCHVTGVFDVQASEQLHGIPFVAIIGLSKNDPNYNDVKGVKDLAGNIPGKGASTAVASGAPPAAAPAWGSAPPAAAPAPTAWGPPAVAAPAPAWTPAPPNATAPAPQAAPPWGPAAPAAAAPPAKAPWER